MTGLTLPTSTEPIYSKAKGKSKKSEKRNSKNESEMNNIEEDRLTQDENKDPKSNKSDSSSSNNRLDSVSKTESKKNKKNRKEREKDQSQMIGKEGTPEERTPSLGSGRITAPAENDSNKGRSLSSSNKRKKGEKSQLNCTTGKKPYNTLLVKKIIL